MRWVQLAAYFFFVTGGLTFLVTMVYWVYSRMQEKRARQWAESFERKPVNGKNNKIVAAPGNHGSSGMNGNT